MLEKVFEVDSLDFITGTWIKNVGCGAIDASTVYTCKLKGNLFL